MVKLICFADCALSAVSVFTRKILSLNDLLKLLANMYLNGFVKLLANVY